MLSLMPRRQSSERTRAAGRTSTNGGDGEVVRREGDRTLPAGPRALRTRNALLTAAADLFSSQGYLETTVGQIAEGAGVGLGTFYQYFRDRADIMGTLVRTTVVDVLKVDDQWDPARGRHGLRRVIEAFVRLYAATAPFQAAWEEVTHFDSGMAELRRESTRLFVDAVAAALEKAAREGIARCDLDSREVARALTSMVDRYCYFTYVFDPPPGGAPPVEATTDLLTSLWADAAGLTAE
jgi:TetR/AcrR family transcriptional regulator, ethionamide resistance regulator